MNLESFILKGLVPIFNPKHTGLFATLFIPAVDKFVHQLYWDNECSDKQICNKTFFL